MREKEKHSERTATDRAVVSAIQTDVCGRTTDGTGRDGAGGITHEDDVHARPW